MNFFVVAGYLVEKCDEDSLIWKKVPGVVCGTSHVVRELVPGNKYNFRVKAENIYGIGAAVMTNDLVETRHPSGNIVVLSYCLYASFFSLLITFKPANQNNKNTTIKNPNPNIILNPSLSI